MTTVCEERETEQIKEPLTLAAQRLKDALDRYARKVHLTPDVADCVTPRQYRQVMADRLGTLRVCGCLWGGSPGYRDGYKKDSGECACCHETEWVVRVMDAPPMCADCLQGGSWWDENC